MTSKMAKTDHERRRAYQKRQNDRIKDGPSLSFIRLMTFEPAAVLPSQAGMHLLHQIYQGRTDPAVMPQCVLCGRDFSGRLDEMPAWFYVQSDGPEPVGEIAGGLVCMACDDARDRDPQTIIQDIGKVIAEIVGARSVKVSPLHQA